MTMNKAPKAYHFTQKKNTTIMKKKKSHIFLIFLLLITHFIIQQTTGKQTNRRILHQPLFPISSDPPPLPPPPPPAPESPEEDRPFFHELPTGPTLDQGGQNPPVVTGAAAANPVIIPPEENTTSSKPIKKIAIAVSSGFLTLGVLCFMGFVVYKHRLKHLDESQKFVGVSTRRNNEVSNAPASTFLYIGTVEPSTRSSVNKTNNETGSPYRKLRTERYRPSPELQPLPPLTKPPPPPPLPRVNLPPPLSSSDDESLSTNFYTPNGSSMSNGSSTSKHSHSRNKIPSIPHSKRTSPKSRLSTSSPDTKPVVIPSTKQSPDFRSGSLQSSKMLTYTPKRHKFADPPPPPDMARLQAITSDDREILEKSVSLPPQPPPPPPPPRSFSMSGKVGETGNCRSSLAPKRAMLPQSTSPKKVSTSSIQNTDSEEQDGSKIRFKPLHWDKVKATSEQATVWDQLNSNSFQLNEDAMESLFGYGSSNIIPRETTGKPVLPFSDQEIRVLDPKKSQNISIILRALNVTREEVSEALIDGNLEGLGADLLETLVKMAPTKEEEIKLKDYDGEISKLGTAERFLKEILDIPFAFKRVDAMLYRENFDTEVKYLRRSFQALEKASEELKNSRLFLKLLEAVLRAGNRMNDGTNRGDARAFKLDTLVKLVDIKGTDGKTTLLHFVVQEIIRSEESHPNNTDVKFKEDEFKRHGLQVLSRLSKELANVKKAAGMDSDVLSGYVSKLESGLQRVRLVLQYEIQGVQGKFFGSMKVFLTEAVEEITRVKAEERKALSLVREVTQYFHADAANEEAHPFRIFMIVKDFLGIMENVCKDVGRMQDKATMSGGRSFRIPANTSLPVFSRYNMPHDGKYDDDDDSN